MTSYEKDQLLRTKDTWVSLYHYTVNLGRGQPQLY